MGGGGSKPASQPAKPAPPVVQSPQQKIVTEDPKPAAGNNTTGVSVSGATESKSILLVNPNISTSVVTLIRNDAPSSLGSSLKCDESTERTLGSRGNTTTCEKRNTPGRVLRLIMEQPHATFQNSKNVPSNACGSVGVPFSDSQKPYDLDVQDDVIRYKCMAPCPSGSYATMESGYTRCWASGGRSPSAEEGNLREIANVEIYKTGVSDSGEISYASDKKMFIKPDKSFEVTIDGKTFTISQMAIYRPCPIRVENVQADAVLSLNDYSDPNAKVVILLPISAAVTYGAPGDFVGRVMQNLDAFTVNEKTGKFNPLVVPVGNDWSLTRVLEVGGGQNGEVSGGYFKWVGTDYEKYVREQSPTHIRYGWKQKPGGVTTILMKDPIAVSYFTSAYLARLQYAPSADSAPAPPSTYQFKAGKCLACSGPPTFDPAKFEEMKKANASGIDPVTVATTIIALVFGIVAFVAIYYALSFALRGYGRSLGGMGVSFAEYLVMPRKPPAAQ